MPPGCLARFSSPRGYTGHVAIVRAVGSDFEVLGLGLYGTLHAHSACNQSYLNAELH